MSKNPPVRLILKRRICAPLFLSSTLVVFLLAFLFASLLASFNLAALADSDTNLDSALQRAHIFSGNQNAHAKLVDKQALIDVYHMAADQTARRKAAVAAARVLVNYAPAQFATVSVKFYQGSNTSSYCDVIVNARDITSLSAGTTSVDELAANVPLVDIAPGDSQASIFNKYLGAAEKQIDQGHFWEAEQIVDSVSRSHGLPNEAAGRFTKDMISLADGFDNWGDPERAEKVLRKIIDHRDGANSLNDSDADRSIQHLVDLLIDAKRYKEADELLTKLLNNPSLSQSANPQAYANNLERLAFCHIKTGQYPQAETELNQVLSIKQQAAGDSSPATAQTLEGMGDLYKAQGKGNDARSLYKRARAIYDHAVVNRKGGEKMDYQVYNAHLKQIDDKLKQL